MKKFFTLLIMSFFLVGCPTDESLGKHSLCIKNNSGKQMYFWFSYDFSQFHFPNTTLPLEKPSNIRGAGSGGCVGNDAGQYPSWDNIFSQLPAGKFTVYFFETNTYPETQEDWELLLSDPNKIHIKNATLDEIRENNYTIAYP